MDFCFDLNSLCVMIVFVFFCAVFGGLYLLISNKPDAIARFKCCKEIMLMFLGMVGLIVGFYMGR